MGAPAWLIAKVWLPTVIAPARELALGFASTEKLIVPLPVPLLVVWTHVLVVEAVHAHPLPVVTLALPLPPPEPGEALPGKRA